jgi:hypothetical protein
MRQDMFEAVNDVSRCYGSIHGFSVERFEVACHDKHRIPRTDRACAGPACSRGGSDPQFE